LLLVDRFVESDYVDHAEWFVADGVLAATAAEQIIGP